MIKNFRDLEIWKLGKEIAVETYHITKEFPREEIFGLVSQMRRAAVSIPSNISEGFSRIHVKEYRQFLFVAFGSYSELLTQIEISNDLRLSKEEVGKQLLDKIDHESRMIMNLIKRLSG